MENETRLVIGGIGVLFKHKEIDMSPDEVEDFMKDCIRPGKADITVNVKIGNPPAYKKGRIIYRSNKNWSLFGAKSGRIIEMYQTRPKEGCVSARLKNRPGRPVLTYVGFIKNQNYATFYIVQNGILKEKRNSCLKKSLLYSLIKRAGRLLVVSRLHRGSGLLFHSAGAIFNGRGALFLGVSGAGKSTIAKLILSSGMDVLNDDRIIVRVQRRKWRIYGNPWPGEGRICSGKKGRLDKIYFLIKSKKNTVRPVTRSESYLNLITLSIPAIWNRESIDSSLRLCKEMAESVPSYYFCFKPDKSAVEFIKEKISGEKAV